LIKKHSALVVAAIAGLSLVSCATTPKRSDVASALQGRAPEAGVPAASQPAPPQAAAALPPAPVDLAAAEREAREAFAANMSNYVSRLKYMVYYDEASGLDPQIARQAVSQANLYVLERGKQDGLDVSVVDFAQIEKSKEEGTASSEPQGDRQGNHNLAIAEKLDATIYIEIDCSVSSDTKDGRYYASAQGSLKIFDVASASVLGSLPLPSRPAFSPSSLMAALSSAVMGSVWTAMPMMYDQSRALLQGALEYGPRYVVVLRKSSDARMLGYFEKRLGLSVSKVEEAFYSADEARLYVYSFQKAEAVEQAIMAAAAFVGIPDFKLSASKGKSYVFTTGLY
jgi:hypothetical protein